MGLLLNDSSLKGFQLLSILGVPQEADRSLVESLWPALPGILEVIAIPSVMTDNSKVRWVWPRSSRKELDSHDNFGGGGPS